MNSTAGEIYDKQVNDDSISLTAIYFEHTVIKIASVQIDDMLDSRTAGNTLAAALDTVNLSNLLIISDGQKVNGTELVQGLQDGLPENVIITGGLAGDGSRFLKTLVGLNEIPREGRIIGIGFYGDKLSVGYGSVGGMGFLWP